MSVTEAEVDAFLHELDTIDREEGAAPEPPTREIRKQIRRCLEAAAQARPTMDTPTPEPAPTTHRTR